MLHNKKTLEDKSHPIKVSVFFVFTSHNKLSIVLVLLQEKSPLLRFRRNCICKKVIALSLVLKSGLPFVLIFVASRSPSSFSCLFPLSLCLHFSAFPCFVNHSLLLMPNCPLVCDFCESKECNEKRATQSFTTTMREGIRKKASEKADNLTRSYDTRANYSSK